MKEDTPAGRLNSRARSAIGCPGGDAAGGGGGKIRIGSVPYLNARPLVRWFTDTIAGRGSGVRVEEAVPSVLADMLEAGELAAALVSSIELFRRPDLCYAAGTGVAAEGPVLSVRMLSRKPIPMVQSVALDTSSLTSVALLKILLAEQYGLCPRYVPSPPDLSCMLASADAALLIGDIGYREYEPSLHVLDLGAAWKELTGLPFVYAVWIGTESSLASVADLLTSARLWGTGHLEQIAKSEFDQRGETLERTRHYLADIMRYEIGSREEEALRLFGEKAAAHGLVSDAADLTGRAVQGTL